MMMALKGELPIFPLRGAVLFPGSQLSLNIFEPRYLAMVDYVLGTDRVIGMIQPRADEPEEAPLYDIGCAGRIVGFEESSDSRYLIILNGISRFTYLEDVVSPALGNASLVSSQTEPAAFRTARVNWDAFSADQMQHDEQVDENLYAHIVEAVLSYIEAQNLIADRKSIKNAPPQILVNSICINGPFGADEKQALLETRSLQERAETLNALIEIYTAQIEIGENNGRNLN